MVSDDALIRQTGFPAGVENAVPQQSLSRDANGNPIAARSLVNVDVVEGKPQTRAGRTLRIAGRWHSPGKIRGVAMFAARDGDLVQTDGDTALATVRAGVGESRISYAEVNGDLLWSNGQVIRRIDGSDLSDKPAWIDCPGVPNVDAYGSGALEAGNYAVAMTWLDAQGRESGAWGSVDVDVAQGQGILVSAIPVAPETAVIARVYVSACNGDELYAAKDLPGGATSTLITANDVREAGKALETLWHQPFPPCDRLRYLNGRLFGTKGNMLVWSPALRHGLHHTDAYMRCGVAITLLEGLDGAGFWMADHKNTYWLQGTDPKKDWRRVIRSDKPAVPGASIIVPGNVVGVETTQLVAFWLAADGVFCVGMPDGTLVRLKEGRLALPQGEAGAMLFREHEGLRQLVTAYMTRGTNGLAIGDTASATVTRY